MTNRKRTMRAPRRDDGEADLPVVEAEGDVRSAGERLGAAWGEALRREAAGVAGGDLPWWRQKRYEKLIAACAPHLPQLYRAMARGAGLHEDQIAARQPVDTGGCTSFALSPPATGHAQPISGQTKDVSRRRSAQLQVLRLKFTNCRSSALSLTYPGWLFGHGFVCGGCSIFRNNLYTGPVEGDMPFEVWGILALHCATVEQVMRLTRDHRVAASFHCTVADEHGDIVGIEHGPGGPVFLRPARGIYVHANAVVSSRRLKKHERDDDRFARADSVLRRRRLYDRLSADRGRLTPQLAYAALMDHANYPRGICRHQDEEAMTGGVVIVEPLLRRMHALRGAPCHQWPRVYQL